MDGIEARWFAHLRARALLLAQNSAARSELHRKAMEDEQAALRLELELQNEDLRANQQALQQARDRYHAMFYRAPVAQVIVDKRGTIIDANLRVGVLLGCHPFRLCRRALSSFMDEPNADALYLHLRHCPTDGAGVHRGELSIRQHDGSQLPIELHTTALADGAPTPRYQLALLAPTFVAAVPEAANWQLSRPGVLVVDDEPAIAAAVATILRTSGVEVFTASSAEDAMSILAREAREFDLLLTDVDMPGVDGRELAAWARDAHPDLAVLFMTGGAAHPQSLSGPVLRKPFHPDELEAAVRAAIEPDTGDDD